MTAKFLSIALLRELSLTGVTKINFDYAVIKDRASGEL